MNILTTVLSRLKISEFIGTIEGRRAFENAQRDIVTLYPQISHLTSDFVTDTGALQDSDMRVSCEAGKIYFIDAMITFKSNATNRGVGIALKVPSGADVIGMFQHNSTSDTFQGSSQTASSSIIDHTKDVYVANQNMPLIGKWLVRSNDSFGDIVLQARSETSGATITLVGGLCVLRSMQVV